MNIQEIKERDAKVAVIEKIVADLPEWFGEGTKIAQIEQLTGPIEKAVLYAAMDEDGQSVGFITLKQSTPYACEIVEMGVLKRMRGNGLGKKLMQHCEAQCLERGVRLLTVKTIAESCPMEGFKATRAFYESCGFLPVDILPTLWGEGFPCVVYLKSL